MYDANDNLKWGKIVYFAIATLFLVIAGLWAIGALDKVYSVWAKEQDGKAALAEAQWSKQVKTEEAKANLESEKLNAQAEIERAKGASESMRIENGQLTEQYIRYLFVRQNDLSDKNTIYVPTEAGLPILEAGKR